MINIILVYLYIMWDIANKNQCNSVNNNALNLIKNNKKISISW